MHQNSRLSPSSSVCHPIFRSLPIWEAYFIVSSTVCYVRLLELLEELAFAKGQGNFKKVLTQWKKTDVLNEWMLISLTEAEARDLLEIIHARHKQASTIFCSQFAPAGWYSKFPEAIIADAILDRILHDSYTIEICGADEHSKKSIREVYGVGRK